MGLYFSSYAVWGFFLTSFFQIIFRRRLLWRGSRSLPLWFRSPFGRLNGHGCVRLPHGQHGSTSLRNVRGKQKSIFLLIPKFFFLFIEKWFFCSFKNVLNIQTLTQLPNRIDQWEIRGSFKERKFSNRLYDPVENVP